MTAPKTNNNNTNQTNRLSVQVSLTGLSFLVSTLEGAFVHFSEKQFDSKHTPEELLIELTRIFSEEAILNNSFSEVEIIYLTHNYTCVPAALFDEKKASEYLKFNTKILGNDFISHDLVENHGIVVVYIPFVNINNFIFEKFGEFTYHHSSAKLLKTILDREKHQKGPRVYVHLNKKQLDCMVIKDGQLQLNNSFLYETPEDLIYYVLFCFEQLKLNPDKVETILCGAIHAHDPLYEILFTYVRNIDFIDGPQKQFMEEEFHEHFLLKVN
ncbi:MAG: DUF3822 family protein [Flavobacteriaceae bacterium]|nr:DUF3822 family protein [Flavobacteriaceae bacterium]